MPSGLAEPDWPEELKDTSPTEVPQRAVDSLTIAVLPDTQYYVSCENRHFPEQLRYLARERERRRILGGVFVGDLTDHNTAREWSFFRASLDAVENLPPLFLTTGNHDLGERGSANSRASAMGAFLQAEFARKQAPEVLLARPDSLENAYYRLSDGGRHFGILSLGWSPTRAIVAWANQVLREHSRDHVLVATHAYLYHDDSRYDFDKKGREQKWNPREYKTTTLDGDRDENHDGERLWNALVRKHANIFLVVSGHVLADGTGRLSSKGAHGNTVHQLLANYQMLREGGLGYLRLLELSADGSTLRVKTYSPSLGLFSNAPDQNFTLKLEPPLD